MAALTACKDCGTQVSKRAENCPNCGRQRPGGGVSSTVVLLTAILGAAFLVFMFQGFHSTFGSLGF